MCDLISWAHIWYTSGFVLKTRCDNLTLSIREYVIRFGSEERVHEKENREEEGI
jgi:hypothetical protein